MHRIFRKEQILTIPNFLSLVRLVLIPIIVWLYRGEKNHYAAVAVLIVSGVTDILDGIIARNFNMVSDFGKILDPIADKLTQAALIISLTSMYPFMLMLIILFVVKELCMGIIGYLAIRKHDSVNSAKWYGKVNTVVLYAVMILLILFPGIPDDIANILIAGCIVMLLLSFIGYIRFYITLFRQGARDRQCDS